MLPAWLKSMLSDGDPVNPQMSMSRFIALSTVLVAIILPGILWFWLSGLECKLLEIPGSVTGFGSAASAIALAMFAANKRAE